MIITMEPAIITSRPSSYTPKRETPLSKPLSSAEARRLGDEYAISQIEEGLKSGFTSREQVMKSLRKR